MIRRDFDTARFLELTPNAIPTLLAYDSSTDQFVIGEDARKIASNSRPVVQDFKLYVAESDPMFEGRYTSARNARPQRLWEVRPASDDKDRWISTKEATKVYLRTLFEQLPQIPDQLIIGVPANDNEEWLRQYRSHMSEILREIGRPNPQFFPEPFAVFQYYRQYEDLLPRSSSPLTVLVIDFGGGTLDSCIIETTLEGNLARGGSTSVPLGIKSVLNAGKAIDRRLLEIGIGKLNISALRQESPQGRIAARPWVVLGAEELKIALSNRMQSCRLDKDCSHIEVEESFPAGWYHPDIAVKLRLNGEDLKRAITDLWFAPKQGFGKSILATVTAARSQAVRGPRIDKIDYVILAGGSSSLPFLKELIGRTLVGQVSSFDPAKILVGDNCDKAVAYGIAIEAAEERNRSLRTHDSIGPCIFNELHMFTARRRREDAVAPAVALIKGDDKIEFTPGTLLPGILRIENYSAEYEVTLPYRPYENFFYWFTATSDTKDPELERINVEQDVIRIPTKAGQKFRLRVSFDDTCGLITPTFVFGDKKIDGHPFSFSGLNFAKDVKTFAGVDFGTSNSYAVGMWAKSKDRTPKYLDLTISPQAGDRLKTLELRLEGLREAGLLSQDVVRRISNDELSDFIFHSIKIEGSTLTRGETDHILSGKAFIKSKASQEPINVREAYRFCVEQSDSLNKTPGIFIRELNKKILHELEPQGGQLRTTAVKLSGMDFQPPDPTEVPALMDSFYEELRKGAGNKSTIQFAAEMHSKLTGIHPFVDGNGRTARLLMNSILVNGGVPAVVINHSDKERYLDCLAATNAGNISEFCVFLAECVESALYAVAPEHPGGDVVLETVTAISDEPLKRWVPSEDLADLMEKRLSVLPVNRRARYEAWAAGFESLREEFRSMCFGFNEKYGHALYSANIAKFDALPFEKYESLLRNTQASKTWFFTLEVQSDRLAEKFVFFFRHLSASFLAASRRQRLAGFPPTDVTLTVARRVSGTYQQLREPIRMREVAYNAGTWNWFVVHSDGRQAVESASLTAGLNDILRDVVAAFL
jgi:molecular chaperone DnaK (HSP70)/fido (protein-threonine AMPylation protein)